MSRASNDRRIAAPAPAVLLNDVDHATPRHRGSLLQAELPRSASQIGLHLSTFVSAYAPVQILDGWLVHRDDVR